jgi:hypothetical protein
MYFKEDIKQKAKLNLQLPGFGKSHKHIAEKHFRICRNANMKDKIYHLQKAMEIYPFSIKFHTAYAILMRQYGKIDEAQEHEKLISGLKLARKKQLQLGIAGNSVYRMALIQYYTGMLHDWNLGYSIASELLNSYRTISSFGTNGTGGFETFRQTPKPSATYSKIANSPHSNRPEVFAKSLQNYKPKSGNARLQWPGANAAICRRGAAVIVFLILSTASINSFAAENNPKIEQIWQEKSNLLLPDN